MADAQAIAAAITAALQSTIKATTAAAVAHAAPIPFACTQPQSRVDPLDYDLPGESSNYTLASKPAAGTPQSRDQPEAPTKEPTKAPTKTLPRGLCAPPSREETSCDSSEETVIPLKEN
jgi:hypothetical protein